MAAKSKYLVFGVGMLALAVGVAISVLMLLATRQPGPGGAAPEAGAPSLSQALEQALGLTPEAAADLARKLQDAAPATTTSPGAEPSLSQALQQALGLTEEEAAALAVRLQEAVAQAQAAPLAESAPGGAPTGANEKASVSDQMDYEVRDASGKLKQRGAGQ
ncbi:MAG: hypothetical protein Q8P22_12925 [Chloroflexota bacterium]|nr:hypothetical protein [Chloroflexota bacterium]